MFVLGGIRTSTDAHQGVGLAPNITSAEILLFHGSNELVEIILILLQCNLTG